MRFRLFEFEDQEWFPGVIRRGMTDYLRFIFSNTALYLPVLPLLNETVRKSGDTKIVDLCSGGGGPVEEICENYGIKYGYPLSVLLTDKFPNIDAFESIHKRSPHISFISSPVDARNVPAHLKGVRTIFSGFHHFNETDARLILKDAVRSSTPVAIFDGGDKNILILLAIMIGHPLIFMFCTPFIKPFRFSRIFFTYIIPLIPVCTVWDGIVSILRLYSSKELIALTRFDGSESFTWKSGKLKNKFGMRIAYLIGVKSVDTD